MNAILACACLVLIACQAPPNTPVFTPVATLFPSQIALPAPTASPTTAQTATPRSSATSTASPSPTATQPPTPRPISAPTAVDKTPLSLAQALKLVQLPSPAVACARPPDGDRRVLIDGDVISLRTLWMLKLAEGLYQGKGSPLLLTQGSFSSGVALSFGTHSGGGAVDVAVVEAANRSRLLTTDDMLSLNKALREAGFAAWIRRPEDLKPATLIHIHAIAIGDPALSPAARKQIDAPDGYFFGWDGVPPEFGGTKRDRYGGPVICPWMRELGYAFPN